MRLLERSVFRRANRELLERLPIELDAVSWRVEGDREPAVASDGTLENRLHLRDDRPRILTDDRWQEIVLYEGENSRAAVAGSWIGQSLSVQMVTVWPALRPKTIRAE